MSHRLAGLLFIFLPQFIIAQTAPIESQEFASQLNASESNVPKSVTVNKEPLQFLFYDQARLLYKQERDTLNYRLALAPYKKRQNRWQPEKEIRLQGRLYSETHELQSGFDELEVFEFYQRQIPSTAKMLFNCERRDCGESNNWANDHFRIKQLYGLDQFQFYSVYQLDENQYITLYVVRRGNRRVYVHIETLVFKPINQAL